MTKIYVTKEYKIKIVIVAVLFVLLALSFFFAPQIEAFLNLKEGAFRHQVQIETLDNSAFKVSYIDVDQGNATFIEFPDGTNALIDAGNVMYGEKVARFIENKGISHIDYLIATHADSDHIGGFNFILNNFEVKEIFRPFQIAGTGTNAQTFVVHEDEDLGAVYYSIMESMGRYAKISRVTSSVYKEFITNIYSETYHENDMTIKSKVTVFYDGLEIVGENYRIKFFAPFVRDDVDPLENSTNTFGYPTKGYGVNESNGNSAIFLVTCFNEKFFFSGDAPWTDSKGDKKEYEEADFVKSLNNDELNLLKNVSVYLVGHHGSAYSSGTELLNVITPRFSVISVGEDNSYGHPAPSTLIRLSKNPNAEPDYLLCTDDFGNIVFGDVDGNLKYSLENKNDIFEFYISWYVLGSIIFVLVSITVLSVKPLKRSAFNN